MTRPALWTSIRDTLQKEIGDGHYAPGDKLPTEADLSHRFGVNRHTVRRAIADLCEAGLLRARRGAGVFVTQKPTLYPLGKRVRFNQALLASGQTPARRYTFLNTRPGDERECEALLLEPGAPVHICEGISLADDQPLGIFRSAFPADRFPDLLKSLETTHSITRAFAENGLSDYLRASTDITATRATAIQATQLGLREGSPILRTVSINVDQNNTPVEYGRSWFAGDHVTLTLKSGDLI